MTVAIILLVNHPESPWMTALHRFLEVSLGVVVALLILVIDEPTPTPVKSFKSGSPAYNIQNTLHSR